MAKQSKTTYQIWYYDYIGLTERQVGVAESTRQALRQCHKLAEQVKHRGIARIDQNFNGSVVVNNQNAPVCGFHVVQGT